MDSYNLLSFQRVEAERNGAGVSAGVDWWSSLGLLASWRSQIKKLRKVSGASGDHVDQKTGPDPEPCKAFDVFCQIRRASDLAKTSAPPMRRKISSVKYVIQMPLLIVCTARQQHWKPAWQDHYGLMPEYPNYFNRIRYALDVTKQPRQICMLYGCAQLMLK